MENKSYVYIVKCRDGSLYTGWTTNLEERIKTHNGDSSRNVAKYTRGRRPVELVYVEEMQNKSEGLKREIAIKKLSREKKLALIDSKLVI